jgi:hypothetical protein
MLVPEVGLDGHKELPKPLLVGSGRSNDIHPDLRSKHWYSARCPRNVIAVPSIAAIILSMSSREATRGCRIIALKDGEHDRTVAIRRRPDLADVGQLRAGDALRCGGMEE